MIKAADIATQLTQSIIDEFKAIGISRIGRYLATGNKSLNQTEINLAILNNVGLFFYYEGYGDAATFAQGTTRGVSDGRTAAQAARTLGVPSSIPISFAVDFNAGASNTAMILAYGAGFYSSSQHSEGIYCDGAVASLEPPAVKIILAGAMGWEGSEAFLKAGKAAAAQHPPQTLPSGVEYDPVDIYDESILWYPGGKPAVVSPSPTPSTANGMPAWSVTGLQLALNTSGFNPGPIDGIPGTNTRNALLRWLDSLP